MKFQLTKTHKLKQTYSFNHRLYDSLDVLKYSSTELFETIFDAMQENPLIELEADASSSNYIHEFIDTGISKNDLKSHLLYQLHTSSQIYNDQICTYIIESLDSNGFFSEDMNETIAYLNTDLHEFMLNLKFIQSFDPCGVAQTSQIESIIYQAEKQGSQYARMILTENQALIIAHNNKELAKQLNISLDELNEELEIIQNTCPFPCSDFETDSSDSIIPDIKVETVDGQLNISAISLYHVQTNDFYQDLLPDDSILKQYLNESKILLGNIEKRNATLMLVAHEMIYQQKDYFLFNGEMQPLTQQDIADKLGMNQTTVSRAVMNKFYLFNNEVYPLSKLFVSATSMGDSSDAIKKALMEIIENEDKTNPFSDEKLVLELEKYNLSVARRTVAKYRDLCHIPSTRKRKKKTTD